MKRYRSTFEFFDTEEQARAFCDKQNALASAYVRKNIKHIIHHGAVKTEQKTSL